MIFNQLSTPKGAITESSELYKTMLAGGGSDSGMGVSHKSALGVTAYYACVQVISETLAQLPLVLFQRTMDRKDRAYSNRLYGLLHDMPNDFQTSFEFRQTKTAQIVTRGTAYSYINRSVTGDILEILPMLPSQVKMVQDKNYKLSYIFTDAEGSEIPLRQDQVWRIIGMSLDGVTGLSPLEYHRQTVGISLAADKHTALTFKNGAKMTGILKHPTHFSDEAVAKRVAESWDAASNGDNMGKTPLLEDGLDWMQVSMTNRDAQYIETRKFQIEDVARIHRVPPHKIGHLEKSTNNNIEHQSLEFVVDTMMPWVKRWEGTITRDLIGRKNMRTYFAKLILDGLLRGDSQARAEFFSKAVGGPWMSANEAREKDDMNPEKGLNEVLKPLNMTPAGENND